MKKIVINGGIALEGKVVISGAKNAALPVMAAALLCDGEAIITNLPNLSDTLGMQRLLENHGAKCRIEGESTVETGSKNRKIIVDASNIDKLEAPYEMVKTMRASVLVLGPLLARFGEARVSLPGGCAIGARPVDFHIKALEALGAKITIENGYINASAHGGLKGGEYTFDKVSVGATENAISAAALAKGTSVFKNCAKEPEIACLADFLNSMGAKISGAGTDTITIEGVARLHGGEVELIPDRIESGTYAIAAAASRGCITIANSNCIHYGKTLQLLEGAGVTVTVNPDHTVTVNARNCSLRPLSFKTEPYPGFPTDMQAQMMTLQCTANGESFVEETIFENRFMHVQELARLGARIKPEGNVCKISGGMKFNGAIVMASDLRASVSLVIAGICAEGQTTIERVYHLFRGYEQVVEKLKALGVDIAVLD